MLNLTNMAIVRSGPRGHLFAHTYMPFLMNVIAGLPLPSANILLAL